MKDFRINFDDYVNAQHLFLGWKRWIIQLSILPVIIYFFFNNSISYYSSIFISFILVLLAVFLVPSLNRKRLRKIYISQKYLQKNITVKFDENYVEWCTDTGSDKLLWANVSKFKINKKILILLTSSNIMHPVPLSAFESKDELNRFLNLLSKHR